MAFKLIQGGGETRVNTTTDGTQFEQSIAALDDGGWIVTWRDSAKEGEGNGRGIFQQRYAADGEKVGGEIHVNTTVAGHQEAPRVTALPGAGWVVTWMSDHDGDGNHQIYQQRYGSNNLKVGDEILVSGALPGSQDYPIVTALKGEHAGGWIVSWLSGHIGDTTIYQQRYDSNGDPAAGGPVAIPATTEYGFHLSVETAALPDGGWIAAWTGGGVGAGEITHQRFKADGTALGEPFTIGGSNAQYPKVTVLTDGSWVIAWSEFQNWLPVGWRVKQQHFMADGTVKPVELVNANEAGSNINPALHALPDGGWIVTWNADKMDSSKEAILQQRYDKDGEKVGGEVVVNTSEDGRQYQPDVTVLDDGSWVIAWWTALNPSGAATGADIYQQRVYTTIPETLTKGIDRAEGTNDNETLRVTLRSLNAGDTLDAGGGMDTLLMVEAGALDLTAPATFQGFEFVEGSDGNDIVIAGNAELTELLGIDGKGGTNVLRLAGGDAVDLAALTIANFSEIVLTNASGTHVTVKDKATAFLLDGEAGRNDHVVLDTDLAFTIAERRLLFSQGIESITDAEGTYVNAAPTTIGLEGAIIRELAAAGEWVGVLSAEDADENESFTFELLDDAGGRFMLWGNEIFVKNGLALDFEQASTHRIKVRVTDAGGKVLEQELTITVTDVNPEFVTGTAAADKIVGGEGSDRLSGAQGDDTLIGAGGDDALEGGEGADYLSGDLGNDILAGGAGADTLIGGGGNDTYLAETGDVIIEVAGGGTDTVLTDASFNLAAMSEVENLMAREIAARTALTLTGNAKANMLVGNAGKNQLDGGAGKDTLTGGAGKDEFIFSAKVDKKSWKANLDKITDYRTKDDTILLDNAVFKKLGKGSMLKKGRLDKEFFVVGSKAKDKNDYLIFDPKKKALLYDADGSGKGAAYQIVTFDKKLKLTMTAAEFLII